MTTRKSTLTPATRKHAPRKKRLTELSVRNAKADLWQRPGRALKRADIEQLVKRSQNKLAFDAADGGFKIILHFRGAAQGHAAPPIGQRLDQVRDLLHIVEGAPAPA